MQDERCRAGPARAQHERLARCSRGGAEADPRTWSTGVGVETLDREPALGPAGRGERTRWITDTPAARAARRIRCCFCFRGSGYSIRTSILGHELQRAAAARAGHHAPECSTWPKGPLARPLDKVRPPSEAGGRRGPQGRPRRRGGRVRRRQPSDGLGLIQGRTLAQQPREISRRPRGAHRRPDPLPWPSLQRLLGERPAPAASAPVTLSELIRRGEVSMRLIGRMVRSPCAVAGGDHPAPVAGRAGVLTPLLTYTVAVAARRRRRRPPDASSGTMCRSARSEGRGQGCWGLGVRTPFLAGRARCVPARP